MSDALPKPLQQPQSLPARVALPEDRTSALREKAAEQRRLGAEPAQSIGQGRPTKRNRRDLADWQRWSASADNIEKGRG